ncbi:MAG: helix-turn-helix domain-containing protein [Dehalococcoidia bacterium]|nr:helix-turn-helix domain-containing protein [Dehalococcoidia bacterium]
MLERFLTVSEAADALRTTPRAVRDKINRGEIRATKVGGKGRWLILESEVHRATGCGGAVRLAEGAAQLAAQLHAPPPEVIFTRDFGGPGVHCARLERRNLDMLLRDLGSSEGIRVTEAAITSRPTESEDREVCWRVTAHGSLELCCPLQADPSFQQLASSLGRTINEQLAMWNRRGGEYLAVCHSVLTRIHEAARARTRGGMAEDLIQRLPRLLPTPPQPLNRHYGDLVYQLAVHCAQKGAVALPSPALYRERRRDAFFSDLILGQAGIHLATAPHGMVSGWARIHRQMVTEWMRSKEITKLLELFRELRRMEAAIKTELHRVASGQQAQTS